MTKIIIKNIKTNEIEKTLYSNNQNFPEFFTPYQIKEYNDKKKYKITKYKSTNFIDRNGIMLFHNDIVFYKNEKHLIEYSKKNKQWKLVRKMLFVEIPLSKEIANICKLYNHRDLLNEKDLITFTDYILDISKPLSSSCGE